MKPKTCCTLGLIAFLMILFALANTITLPAQPKSRPSDRGPMVKGAISYIDGHNHLHGQIPSRGGREELDYEGAARVALATMDQFGITRMIIMPPPFIAQQRGIYDYGDLIGVVKKHPDRFAFFGGGGTLNAMIHRAAHEREVTPQLRETFKKAALEILSKGAIGFGEMAAEHLSLGPDHPYESAPADHPLFLLLADIAAERNVPIDIHMEAIPEPMPLPAGLSSPPNPKTLSPNIAAFERLLAHNRKAKIIWAHAGWCNTGGRTAALCAALLRQHPNLFMSFKIRPQDSRLKNRPLEPGAGIKEEWLQVIREFPDRFIIGSDQFYLSPGSPMERVGASGVEPTNKFFALLPPDLARQIGQENPQRIFNLR